MGASGSDQAFYGDKANVEPTAPSHGSDPVGAERLRRSPPSSSLDPEVHVRNRDVGGGSGGGGEEKEGERRAGLQEEVTTNDVWDEQTVVVRKMILAGIA